MENNKLKNGINEIRSIVMTDSEKARVFDNILKASTSNSKPIKSPWVTFSFVAMLQSNRLVYYIVIPLIIILSSGGVVFASQDSLPDNILYPIKVKVLEPMEGALALARLNISLTNFAPSPINFWTNSEPTTSMKVAWVLLATALANRVLPVPGGP